LSRMDERASLHNESSCRKGDSTAAYSPSCRCGGLEGRSNGSSGHRRVCSYLLPLTCSLSTILRIHLPCAFLLSPYMQVPSLPKHRAAAERRGRGGKALSSVRRADRPLSCAPLSACERSPPHRCDAAAPVAGRGPF